MRIVGQAPLAATVYELDRLRCNLCGEVFTAPEPEGIGPEKYDETTAAMIALLKYGSGMPFYRLEKLEQLLGIPLPASTQWEIVEEAAEVIKAARDELIRQAAQGEVLHNDDTSMRVLRLAREPSDDRTGVFTSGIVSTQAGRRIALYFTGRQHAGENLRDVLQHRTTDLARPLQMCDALSRNTPKLTDGAEILLANCLAHGRRQFVEVAANFPEPCRYVLETLGDVYKYDAEARERHLSPAERLAFHQQHSGPVMEQLHQWLEAQFALKQVEPNSGLGKAITYLLRHWKGLTAFLREAGAPLDNNICERALKRAVLHRKNALFYRTLHGAEAGRSVHEPDPHLRARRCQSVRLPHSNCSGTPANWRTTRRRGCPGTTSNKLSPATIISFRPPSATLRKCPQNRPFRKSAIPAGFLATPIRVGLYARVSTHDQQTLPLQIRAMREYAAKRGWTIVAQIKEVGSGASQRELREDSARGRSSARNRCRTGVASGSLGPVRRRSGFDAPGTSASRRGFRFADRSARSDHARGSRHGRTARGVRRVRTRDPTRTRPRRS